MIQSHREALSHAVFVLALGCLFAPALCAESVPADALTPSAQMISPQPDSGKTLGFEPMTPGAKGKDTSGVDSASTGPNIPGNGALELERAGCSSLLDSVRQAFRNSDPEYLAWEIIDTLCSEPQVQEILYYQGLGLAIVKRPDLATAYWERALILRGVWREKVLYRLWESAKEKNDSVNALAYAVLMLDEFPHSDFLPEMGANDSQAHSPSYLGSAALPTQSSRMGWHLQREIQSTRTPSYSRDLGLDRAQWEWSARRDDWSFKANAMAEVVSDLHTGLPQQPQTFFRKLGESRLDQASAQGHVSLVWDNWFLEGGASAINDFQGLAGDTLARGVQLAPGWAGPSWSLAAGYFDFLDNLDWSGSFNLLFAQVRRNWQTLALGTALTHDVDNWTFDVSVNGELHFIQFVDSVSAGLAPTYLGFWSVASEMKAAAAWGRHHPVLKVDYRFQRDRYSEMDPYQLGFAPGRRTDVETVLEYRYQPRNQWYLACYVGAGGELNRDTGRSSGWGGTARLGFSFQLGD